MSVVRYIWETIIEIVEEIVELVHCVVCEVQNILGYNLIIDSELDRTVLSETKQYASAFNNANVSHCFGYSDGGNRYEFRINEHGEV